MNQMAAETRICTEQKITQIKMHCYRRKCENMADMARDRGSLCKEYIGETM